MRGFGDMQEIVIKRRRLKHGMRVRGADRVISVINIIFILFIVFLCVIPFIYTISISLTSEEAFSRNGITLIPSEFSLSAYATLFRDGRRLFISYANTLFITVVGTLISLIIMTGWAYPLSKADLPFRKGFLGYLLFSMLFSGGLIPFFLVVKNVFGLYNSIWAMILPYCVSSWNIILMKNFFQAIPDSLEESARLEGANELQILVKIVLPLSKSIIATITLFTAVYFWNSWYGSLLFITDTNKQPIMMYLKEMTSAIMSGSGAPGSDVPTQGFQMAVVVACMLPIICVYPFLQKHFAKGVMVGSVKG